MISESSCHQYVLSVICLYEYVYVCHLQCTSYQHISNSHFELKRIVKKNFCWPYNCNDELREKEDDDYGESDIIIYTL